MLTLLLDVCKGPMILTFEYVLTMSTCSCFFLLTFLKKKEVWNFSYFSGVGGFEKVIFHRNKKTVYLRLCQALYREF